MVYLVVFPQRFPIFHSYLQESLDPFQAGILHEQEYEQAGYF